MERQMSAALGWPLDRSLLSRADVDTFNGLVYHKCGQTGNCRVNKDAFFLLRSRGETLAGESVQNMWFPHPRSNSVQRALSAWNTLLVRSPDLIASFGVGLLWPYPFTSRMPFLMITNIIFMTFMCCKILFLVFIHTWVTWCLSPYCFQSFLLC